MNTNEIEIVPLEEHHIPEVGAVAAEAFLDDPSTIAIVKRDREKRLKILRKHFGMQASMSLSQGLSRCAILGGKIVGAMIVTPPGSGTIRIADMIKFLLQSLFQASPAIIWRGIQSSLDDERSRPEEPNYYLETLGVSPALHGRGIGTLLLKHLNEMADREGIMVYLSSTEPKAVPFYNRHGFKTIMQGTTLGVPYHHMLREAKK